MVVDCAADSGEVLDLFEAVSRRLRRFVPFDASVLMATDPGTGLPAAPTRAENMEQRARLTPGECIRIWEGEFLTEDVTPYSELGRAVVPASGLRLATRDRPARSPRYRGVLQDKGFDDELRAVLRADGKPWGLITLFRDRGRPGFDEQEVALLASLSEPLAHAVRERTRPSAADRTAERGPGLLLFTPTGELASINDEALAWLDELASDFGGPANIRSELPLFILATATRARAVAGGRENGVARARLRSRTGRWLVCHASCMRNADGTLGETALVIEPAKASEIAPIIIEAYDLTAREAEIARLIARGAGTAEIASGLGLSPHTVRDYVKAIFEKVGVSSRGELVAKLFAEHYAPIHLDPSAHQSVSES